MNSDAPRPTLGQTPQEYSREFIEKTLNDLRKCIETLLSPGVVRGAKLNLSQIPSSNTDLRSGDTWQDNSFVRIYPGAAQDTLSEITADAVGAMLTGNTETGIAVTYQDSDNTIDFVLSDEYLQDVAGAMVTGGTETGITVTYDDTNARFDFVVSDEFVADTVGAMVTGNTETNITVTYDDTDNTIDFVVPAASETVVGAVELATSAETITGTDTGRVITPASAAAAYQPLIAVSTFTPTMAFATPGDSIWAYSSQVGVYIKIGRLVNVFIQVFATPTIGTASGVVRVTGLPFTPDLSNVPLFSAATDSDWTWGAGRTMLYAVTTSGSAFVTLQSSGTGVSLSNLTTSSMVSGNEHILILSGWYRVAS